ncbi:hypothetical protein IX307_001934 [Bacteroides pyogenes]|uniref:DUF6064 family protein n=1 Tax=Bacteroides pyogenes TaxID=310300 RepID=UPI001BA72127|nr:DUF6064 family protein [Bacteroides pyogenes]MBR8720779.1 hypothetical protein [Bacteroides pyogenes]MBR8724195.1 hypothetical protein [Bacteroides pyogenes]MBR8737410.1 hypothetical protein [Bacteroides pyogenes]MBR8753344.1 hypothetical protein [Bacteroides pyogenes]MBR8787603.1 hypothetical protein [Bacteroides pyogenes]
MEIFWRTIAYYNSATWILQILIVLLGFALTAMLVRKPLPRVKIAMKLYMITLYSWIAVAYYFIYCEERSYNGVMAMFWGVMAVIWIWDLITGYTTFERMHKYDALSYFLLAMPFVYPLVSLARGLEFPEMTSPVMPCSVVVFTIGLLLLFARKVNMFLVLFLCHWSLIGLSKTYFFRIPEDFLLASATIPGLYLFFREYFLNNLHADTKPKAKYINWLLLFVCVGVAVLLTGTLFLELTTKS